MKILLNMNALVKMVSVAMAALSASVCCADAVMLNRADRDGTAAGGEASFMSSFLANPSEAGYGWSDGCDPSSDKDYLVAGNNVSLRTPYREDADLASQTFAFPGRSLTLNNGGRIAFRSSYGTANNAATVWIDDLIVKNGVLSHANWARATKWGGKITIDTASTANGAASFTINMSTCHILAKMVAADGEKVTLEGPTMAQLNSAGDYRWIDQAHPYLFRFSGDCTEYRATTFCAWGSQALLATSDFAGSFSLGNIGSITVDGISSATVHGAITSRDGYVRIPVATALDVRGGIDSAFADFTTHVYQGTNVYTRLAADVPYVNVNGVSGGSVGKSASVNALILSEGASLSTPMANLDGTLVSLSSNATLTVGNVDFTDVILDVADDGKLVVTNSFTTRSPVKLRLNGITAQRSALVTMPTSCGKLDVGDFTFDAPQFQYVLSVGTADGVQTLWAENLNPTAKDAMSGYVILENPDGNSQATFTYGSYNQAGGWSDGLAPHAGAHYYTNGKLLRDKELGTEITFKGSSLTQCGIFRPEANSLSIPDWRVVSNGGTKIDNRTMLNVSGAYSTKTFGGTLRVFTDAASPFTLYGGITKFFDDGSFQSQTYRMLTKIVGSGEAVIAAEGALSRAPGDNEGQAVCEFLGDMGEYYGSLWVGTNQTAVLGSTGLANGTLVMRTAWSMATTKVDAGTSVPVRRLETHASATLDVPEATTLAVTEGTAITGTLTKNGLGTLALVGMATPGEEAGIRVAAGTLKVSSAMALSGVSVAFADGAGLVIDWGIEDGIILDNVVCEGARLPIAFDFTDAEPTFEKPCVKKLLTVNDSDAAAIMDKIAVRRVKGYCIDVLPPVSENGLTTFSVRVYRLGFVLTVH